MSTRKNKKQYQQYDRSLSLQHLQSSSQLVGFMTLRRKLSLNMVKIDLVEKIIINLQFMPKNVRSSFVKKMIKEIVTKLLSLSLIKKDTIFLKCLADFVAISLFVLIINKGYLQSKKEN